MKKLLLFVTALIISISIVRCGGNSEKKNEKGNALNQNDSSGIISTPYEVKGDETFNLSYKFVPGNSFKYRLTISSSTDRNVVTDSTINDNYEQKATQTISFNAVSIERDTIANLKCTFTDVDVYRNMNGNIETYKSSKKQDPTQLHRFVEYEGIVNNPFNIKVSQRGNIIDVFNVETITDKFIELSNMNKTVTKDDKAMFQQQIIESFLKPMLTQVFRELPGKDIKIGGDWEKSLPTAEVMFFKITYQNKYNLESIEKIKDDKVAVITGKAITSIEGETKKVDGGIEYNFQKPKASADGKIYFDIDKGMLYKSITGSKLEFNYNMQRQGPTGLQKASSKQSVITKNIVELL